MGIPTLISTATASDSSSIDITSGIDSTYDEYMFVFTDINPATDAQYFVWQANASGGSGFNETITSTFFLVAHAEDGLSKSFGYGASYDQAQGTAFQYLTTEVGSGSDECCAGTLHLFNPSSTTYVKHFYSRVNALQSDDWSFNNSSAGYINTTSAIDEVSFKMISGNLDGVIQMYGIS